MSYLGIGVPKGRSSISSIRFGLKWAKILACSWDRNQVSLLGETVRV